MASKGFIFISRQDCGVISVSLLIFIRQVISSQRIRCRRDDLDFITVLYHSETAPVSELLRRAIDYTMELSS